MKKYSIIFLWMFMGWGCSGFLDSENLMEKNSDNYPQTPNDAYSTLMGVYHAYAQYPSWGNTLAVSEVMCDDRFGGGGQNDRTWHACNVFKKTTNNMYEQTWSFKYTTIYRANFLLESLSQVNWDNDAQRKKIEGQAYFLRALTYLDLCRMFGTAPLLTSSNPENKPRASADELFAQIASDLKNAIECLPNVSFNNIPKDELALATKWAAEALMARAFLFYTGYYGKTEMGSVTKDNVISWLEDCINNSGHDLLPDFRSQWPYAYANKDYGYAKDNNLSWIGEDGANNETVFAIKHTTLAEIDQSITAYRNELCVNFGLRQSPVQVPFGQGWGMGPINPQLYDEWPDEDLRKKGSIYNVNDPAEGIAGYTWGADMQYHETGFWQKKIMPIYVYDSNGKPKMLINDLYNLNLNYRTGNLQDLVLIRFADILLMAAELGGTNAQKHMDRVRTRVNLPSVQATLENIKKERRYELAFEGIRYFDLLRWHDAETAYAKVHDVPVMNNSIPSTITITYRPVTGGFLPIPESQILLSNGVLTQTPGWTDAESLY